MSAAAAAARQLVRCNVLTTAVGFQGKYAMRMRGMPNSASHKPNSPPGTDAATADQPSTPVIALTQVIRQPGDRGIEISSAATDLLPDEADAEERLGPGGLPRWMTHPNEPTYGLLSDDEGSQSEAETSSRKASGSSGFGAPKKGNLDHLRDLKQDLEAALQYTPAQRAGPAASGSPGQASASGSSLPRRRSAALSMLAQAAGKSPSPPRRQKLFDLSDQEDEGGAPGPSANHAPPPSGSSTMPQQNVDEVDRRAGGHEGFRLHEDLGPDGLAAALLSQDLDVGRSLGRLSDQSDEDSGEDLPIYTSSDEYDSGGVSPVEEDECDSDDDGRLQNILEYQTSSDGSDSEESESDEERAEFETLRPLNGTPRRGHSGNPSVSDSGQPLGEEEREAQEKAARKRQRFLDQERRAETLAELMQVSGLVTAFSAAIMANIHSTVKTNAALRPVSLLLFLTLKH